MLLKAVDSEFLKKNLLVSFVAMAFDSLLYLLVIFVSMLCVMTTAFSSSLSIRLLFPVLVGSSFDRSRWWSCSTLFVVSISWLIRLEQSCVVTERKKII